MATVIRAVRDRLGEFAVDRGTVRRIVAISLPLMGTMVGNLLMMLVDRICLARYSPATLAASGPAVFTTMTIVAIVCDTVGISRSFVAQANGRNGPDAAADEASVGLLLGLVFGALLFACAPLVALIPTLSTRPADIVALESVYMLWGARFGAVMVLNTALSSYFNGVGHTRITLRVGILGLIVDIVFTVGLVFGRFGLPELGMRGSAIGTLIGTCVMFACYAWLLPRQVWAGLGRLLAGRVRPLGSRVALRLRRGLPSGLTAGAEQVGNTAFIWIVAILGATALAANNVNLTINYVGIIPLIGMGIGCSILCATAAGQGKYGEFVHILRATLAIELVYVLVVSIVQVAAPELLLRAFGDLGGDPQLLATAIATERVLWTFSASFAFSMTGSAVLECLGMARYSLLVRLGLMWGLCIPLIYLLASGHRGDPSQLQLCWIVGSVFELAIGIVYMRRIARAVRAGENRLHGDALVADKCAA